MSINRPLVLGLAASCLAAVQAVAQSPATGSAHIRCKLSAPSGVKEPLTIAAQIYRVSRDAFGEYKSQGQPQSLYVNLTPGPQSDDSSWFETDIELGDGVEYELRVVALDNQGYERKDGGYLLVSPDATDDYFEQTVTLRPGEINELYLNLRWIGGEPSKSNLMQVVPRAGHPDYELSLYTNESTNISTVPASLLIPRAQLSVAESLGSSSSGLSGR